MPEHISRDADEAHRCHSIGAHRAAVVMARRAVQALAVDKGASVDAKLVAQIEHLAENGVITEAMKDVATVVRLSGNSGAHPGDQPDLDELSEDEATDVLDFLDELLRHVYQTPHRVQRLRDKRAQSPS